MKDDWKVNYYLWVMAIGFTLITFVLINGYIEFNPEFESMLRPKKDGFYIANDFVNTSRMIMIGNKSSNLLFSRNENFSFNSFNVDFHCDEYRGNITLIYNNVSRTDNCIEVFNSLK